LRDSRALEAIEYNLVFLINGKIASSTLLSSRLSWGVESRYSWSLNSINMSFQARIGTWVADPPPVHGSVSYNDDTNVEFLSESLLSDSMPLDVEGSSIYEGA
jgi:hypothetical protein